jgi:predicted nuclease of predicted toxin-antitoxin system
MRVLIDVNLSRNWVAPLAEAGHEALHWLDAGPADASDEAIMRWADEKGYAILTNDKDFARMLALSQRRSPSVIQIRSGTLRPRHLKDRLIHALELSEKALTSGALVTVDASQTRLHILPFGNKTET